MLHVYCVYNILTTNSQHILFLHYFFRVKHGVIYTIDRWRRFMQRKQKTHPKNYRAIINICLRCNVIVLVVAPHGCHLLPAIADCRGPTPKRTNSLIVPFDPCVITHQYRCHCQGWHQLHHFSSSSLSVSTRFWFLWYVAWSWISTAQLIWYHFLVSFQFSKNGLMNTIRYLLYLFSVCEYQTLNGNKHFLYNYTIIWLCAHNGKQQKIQT